MTTDHLTNIKQALERHAAVSDAALLKGDAWWQYAKDAGTIQSWCTEQGIRSLLERLEAAERDAERAKRCALKYLDYLGIHNRRQGLERDMLDPDMVGEELSSKAAKEATDG